MNWTLSTLPPFRRLIEKSVDVARVVEADSLHFRFCNHPLDRAEEPRPYPITLAFHLPPLPGLAMKRDIVACNERLQTGFGLMALSIAWAGCTSSTSGDSINDMLEQGYTMGFKAAVIQMLDLSIWRNGKEDDSKPSSLFCTSAFTRDQLRHVTGLDKPLIMRGPAGEVCPSVLVVSLWSDIPPEISPQGPSLFCFTRGEKVDVSATLCPPVSFELNP